MLSGGSNGGDGIMMPSSYLKTYPYLFVKESDQADYFCTLCEEYVKEGDHQNHLFESHRASPSEEHFVRVSDNEDRPSNSLFSKQPVVDVCVICWAKVVGGSSEMSSHRALCKIDRPSTSQRINGEESPFVPEVILDETPTTIKSSSSRSRRKQTAPQQHIPLLYPKIMQSSPQESENSCFQCSLCSALLPSGIGYANHLQSFHRISPGVFDSDSDCPLCLHRVSLMELSDHLTDSHGLVPQTAVNSLILWILTRGTSKVSKEEEESFFNKQLKSERLTDQDHLMTLPPPLTFPLGGSYSSQQMLAAAMFINEGGGGVLPHEEPRLVSPPQPPPPAIDFKGKLSLSSIVCKFSRSHVANDKQSFQCCLCSKWFAVPPIKHMKSHIIKFKQEQKKYTSLLNGSVVCLLCYSIFETPADVLSHMEKYHESSKEEQIPLPVSNNINNNNNTTVVNNNNNGVQETKGVVELDNAGRVKSGKVRKQCELCGEWSNIKWFFKHMSEVHQALFCRCCREYLPIPEQEDHRRWHAEPPYMGQKIRIENGRPIIIDRKERASLTPIGSLAPWGGSSGGMVVKAVDDGGHTISTPKKRKTSFENGVPLKMMTFDSNKSVSKDTLMPKETCPVCGILITYKNLARHIKLRHKIKYKFCHKCRKLVPNSTYDVHKASHGSGNCVTELSSPEVPVEDLEPPPTMVITPTPFSAVEPNDEIIDNRKSESFRANTSKTKLESLLGKEFKHPRRKCALCGYSVSYSNFKRHLRNAHPIQYQECENNPGAFKRVLASLALPQDGDEEYDEDDGKSVDESTPEGVSSVVECRECGDHIVSEFFQRHMQNNHPTVDSPNEEQNSESVPDVVSFCPICEVQLAAKSVGFHCKVEHDSVVNWCGQCSKFVPRSSLVQHKTTAHHNDLTSNPSDNAQASDNQISVQSSPSGQISK